jgi:hypothetical protein
VEKKLVFLYSLSCPYSEKVMPFVDTITKSLNLPIIKYVLENYNEIPIPKNFYRNYYPVLFVINDDKFIEIDGFMGIDAQKELYEKYIDKFFNPKNYNDGEYEIEIKNLDK